MLARPQPHLPEKTNPAAKRNHRWILKPQKYFRMEEDIVEFIFLKSNSDISVRDRIERIETGDN